MTRSKNMSSTGRTTDLKRRDEAESGSEEGKERRCLLVLESRDVDEVVGLLSHLLRVAISARARSVLE